MDMNNTYIYAIGLMSGTSLDGLDIIYVRFDEKNLSNFKILAAKAVPYTTYWREQLKNGMYLPPEEIEKLSTEYGVYLGIETRKFIEKNKMMALDFIASHGHTIFHQPERSITLQIGDGQTIANYTNCKVVCDFRTQDV